MNAILAWAAMGGYGAYVWPAYGIAAVVLGGLVLVSWRRHRRSSEELAQLQQGARQ